MNQLNNVVKGSSGRIESWAQGNIQYRVTRDSAGKPLQVSQYPRDPYNGVMRFKYREDGSFDSVNDMGLIDPIIVNTLKEEALNKGAMVVMATTSPGVGVGVAKIVSLTQAQYNALVTKDPVTLYVIVEG